MSNTTCSELDLFKTTVATAIGVTGFLGNAFVIIVFLSHTTIFNTITNLLILNQSAIDLAVSGVFLIGQFKCLLPKISGGDLFDTLVCRLWDSEYILWALYVCSSMNLVAISLERFCATCYPIKHLSYFTRLKTKLIMLCVWLFGFLYECHWPYSYELVGTTCGPRDRDGTALVIFASFIFFGVEYVGPVLVMTFSYWRIITMLKRRGKQREFFRRAKHSVTKTLLIVSVMFVICWGPAEIEYFLFNLLNLGNLDGPIHQLGITLVQLNACLNPCIYSLQYKQFKAIVKKTLCPTCLDLGKDSSSERRPTSGNSQTKNISSNHHTQNNV